MNSEHCARLIRQINCATEKRINNELRDADLTHAQICLAFALIEKENGWTVLSAIRAIPKQAENSEDDALMKILQGGESSETV